MHKPSDKIDAYVQGRMTPQERHAFEVEMTSDPFLQDAVDGYEELGHAQVAEALKRKNPFVEKRQPYWMVAASVALLLGVFSAWWFFGQEEPSAEMAMAYELEADRQTQVAPTEEEVVQANTEAESAAKKFKTTEDVPTQPPVPSASKSLLLEDVEEEITFYADALVAESESVEEELEEEEPVAPVEHKEIEVAYELKKAEVERADSYYTTSGSVQDADEELMLFESVEVADTVVVAAYGKSIPVTVNLAPYVAFTKNQLKMQLSKLETVDYVEMNDRQQDKVSGNIQDGLDAISAMEKGKYREAQKHIDAYASYKEHSPEMLMWLNCLKNAHKGKWEESGTVATIIGKNPSQIGLQGKKLGLEIKEYLSSKK